MAVGETLRRLAGKVLLATGVSKAQVASLAPTQVGVGVRCAAESVAMGHTSTVDSLAHTTDWAVLKVDLRNAFNTVDRLAVLKGALEYAPAAYNYLKYAYQGEAPLYVGESILASQTGTHQGCPLGPLGFALAIHPILQAVNQQGQLTWSSWYLDDGIMLGSATQLLNALRALQPAFQAVGLQINLAKCELWGPAAPLVKQACPDIALVPWVPTSGITVLGFPLNYPGYTVYQDSVWATCLSKLRKATESVGRMSDVQLGHHLLRQCLDACKVNHLLRSTECYSSTDGVTAAARHLCGLACVSFDTRSHGAGGITSGLWGLWIEMCLASSAGSTHVGALHFLCGGGITGGRPTLRHTAKGDLATPGLGRFAEQLGCQFRSPSAVAGKIGTRGHM